jgi:hypothetical protein
MNLLNFATWNIQDICHKEDQVEDNLIKKNIHIAVMSETVRQQRCTEEINHCVQIHNSVNWKARAQARVMILISKFLKQKFTVTPIGLRE